ncbi:MAG: PEP-CTERM sorting domain-containing protein [Akkermansiaceae bacterium]
MKRSHTIFCLALSLIAGGGSLNAASLSISGTNFSTLSNSSGASLSPGSIIQVGYLLGIDPTTADPSAFGETEWDTFTALTGPFSLNSSLTAATEDINASFVGVYRLNLTIDDASLDENAKTFPAFPTLLAVRVFDTTISGELDSAEFNTATSSLDSWIATGPDGVGGTGTVLGMAQGGEAGNPQIFWEFNESPFQTVAVPEPNSLLSTLFGLGLLATRRRRE